MGQQSGVAVVELHTDLTQAGEVTGSGLRQGAGHGPVRRLALYTEEVPLAGRRGLR